MKEIILGSIVLSMSLLFAPPGFSHCEVPCGIYRDEMRFDIVEEHITTIEKCMKLVVELTKERDKNYNQIVRWVNNKEKHANYIQHIVCQYFMTQRVKPVDEKNTEEHKKYVKQITLLHEMLVYAMKAKQTTDLANVEKIRSVLASFRTAYFGAEGKECEMGLDRLVNDFSDQLHRLLKEIQKLPESEEYRRLQEELDRLAKEAKKGGKEAMDKLEKEILPKIRKELDELRKRLRELGKEKEIEPLEVKFREIEKFI